MRFRRVPSFLASLIGLLVVLPTSCGGKTDLGVPEPGSASSSGSGSSSGAHGSSASSSGVVGSSSGAGSGSGFGSSSSGSGGSSGFGSSGGSGSSSGIGSSSGPIDAGGFFDGTTGQQCKADADCQPPGGPGVNKCTSDKFFGGGPNGADSLYPTSVCMSLQNCDPGTDGLPHYCDGPDDPSSPGICLTTGGAGQGICLPQCAFGPDGSPAAGCAGKDSCFVFSTTLNALGHAVGYCFGGCEVDGDCQAPGQHCQTDQGTCVGTVTKDSPPGAGCNTNANPYPCNCIANPSTGLGYCAPFCRVGGTACAAGTTCDASLPNMGWKVQNPGLAGYCASTCKPDAGACPPNSTCQNVDVAGPDCLP